MKNPALYEEAVAIRARYRAGLISREEAKKAIEPYARFFNETAAEKAKKYNVKAQKFSFVCFMR